METIYITDGAGNYVSLAYITDVTVESDLVTGHGYLVHFNHEGSTKMTLGHGLTLDQITAGLRRSAVILASDDLFGS